MLTHLAMLSMLICNRASFEAHIVLQNHLNIQGHISV